MFKIQSIIIRIMLPLLNNCLPSLIVKCFMFQITFLFQAAVEQILHVMVTLPDCSGEISGASTLSVPPTGLLGNVSLVQRTL